MRNSTKRGLFILPFLLAAAYCSFSQSVGIGTNTPDGSAALDISNSAKGLLIPRMSTGSINTIANPAKGLLAYDSVTNQLMVNTGTPAAPNWRPIATDVSEWNIAGNSGINPANQFIGNTDNQPLRFRVNNIQAGELNPVNGNIAWGLRANQSVSTGFSNIAIGTDALKKNTRSNIVAIGDSALFNNGFGASFSTNSVLNTAVGSKSLFSNILGANNTAVGSQTLMTNSDGSDNTALGSQSLLSNTDGSANTATGARTLLLNTSGSNNTAAGSGSLLLNTTGSGNTASGVVSLLSNTSGSSNTANGTNALRSNSTGNNNTSVGNAALFNSNGNNNTAVGVNALGSTTGSDFNTAVGFSAAVNFNLGFNNTLLGANADVNQNSLFNCVAVGESARCTASSQVRFGNSSTVSIGGIVGYTNLSDGRYKKNVQAGVKGIDFIMKLRPVTYQLDIAGLDSKLNTKGGPNELSKKSVNENGKTVFSGFIAQEVEQAARETGYDFSGIDKPKNENDLYGLRYAEFVVPVVKAMQEQQVIIATLQKQVEAARAEIPTEVGKQQQVINDLKKQIDQLQKRVLDLEKSK